MYRKSGIVAALALVLSIAASAGDKTFAIGDQEAVRTALDKTGGGQVMELRLDRDSGAPAYSLLIVDNGTRYDVRVDAATGEVMKFAKREIQRIPSIPRGMAGGSHLLNPEVAVQAALAASNGGVLVRSDAVHRYDGRNLYELEIIRDNTKFAMDIDANTGEVVHYTEARIQGSEPVTVASK